MLATLTPSKNGKIYVDLDAHILSTFIELNKLHNVMKCLYQITFFKLSGIIINDMCVCVCVYVYMYIPLFHVLDK